MDKPVTQRQFSEIVGVSEAAVSGFIKRAIIIDGQCVGSWLKGYCAHLREQAAERAASGDLDLATERARLAREQADKVAMQNAERRGELAPVSAMEMVLANTGAKVGRILDTIPGTVRRRVPGVSSEVIEAITTDIAKCRNMAAAMTLSSLNDDAESDDDSPSVDGE